MMFDEIETPRGAKKVTYSQLPAESLKELDQIPVAHSEPQSVIEARLAIARVFIPRARTLEPALGGRLAKRDGGGNPATPKRELNIVLP